MQDEIEPTDLEVAGAGPVPPPALFFGSLQPPQLGGTIGGMAGQAGQLLPFSAAPLPAMPPGWPTPTPGKHER